MASNFLITSSIDEKVQPPVMDHSSNHPQAAASDSGSNFNLANLDPGAKAYYAELQQKRKDAMVRLVEAKEHLQNTEMKIRNFIKDNAVSTSPRKRTNPEQQNKTSPQKRIHPPVEAGQSLEITPSEAPRTSASTEATGPFQFPRTSDGFQHYSPASITAQAQAAQIYQTHHQHNINLSQQAHPRMMGRKLQLPHGSTGVALAHQGNSMTQSYLPSPSPQYYRYPVSNTMNEEQYQDAPPNNNINNI